TVDKFVVVKSLTRSFGWAIKAPPNITWAMGPDRTFGWYRFKADAEKRAEELNRANCTPTAGQPTNVEKDMIAVNQPSLFKLGQVVATPGAIEALEKAGQAPWEFLVLHAAGNWGIVSDEDKEANDQSVKDGSRILSAYHLKTGVKIWVITEATD